MYSGSVVGVFRGADALIKSERRQRADSEAANFETDLVNASGTPGWAGRGPNDNGGGLGGEFGSWPWRASIGRRDHEPVCTTKAARGPAGDIAAKGDEAGVPADI
jgi:hypothetical protein